MGRLMAPTKSSLRKTTFPRPTVFREDASAGLEVGRCGAATFGTLRRGARLLAYTVSPFWPRGIVKPIFEY